MAYPAQKYTMEIPDENCVDPGGDSDFTPTGTSPSLADPTLNRPRGTKAPFPREAPAAPGTWDTVSVDTVSVDMVSRAGNAPGPPGDRDPDDDIDLPEDTDMEEYLNLMEVLCPDMLAGKPCHEATYCSAPFKLCQSFQVGGKCEHTTFIHDDLIHVRRTCKSILQGVPCARREKGEECGYGHDHKYLRGLIEAWRRARADGRTRLEQAMKYTPRDGATKISDGQRKRRARAAYKAKAAAAAAAQPPPPPPPAAPAPASA